MLELALSMGKLLASQFFSAASRLVLPVIALSGGIILWRQVMDKPTNEQLIGLALYGAFIVLPSIFRNK